MNSIKNLLITILLIIPFACFASGKVNLIKGNWAFKGPFGKFDNLAIQRGLKVFKEVCASCHGVSRMPFRKLTEIGFSEAEAKQFASEFNITDGPNDKGEMFERTGIMSDYWPVVYKNDKQAALANNGSVPPDLSLITKARVGGADYVYSLLQGYVEKPEGFNIPNGSYYNLYMTGNVIAMTSPLHSDELVEYDDETKATVNQMAFDVTNFLQWVAEPEMEHRKSLGVKVVIFSLIMTIFFYISKKKIWKNLT